MGSTLVVLDELIGGIACLRLRCRVGARVPAWRPEEPAPSGHSDLHILTVGRYTYTADNRYQSIYNPTTDEWILQVDIIVISQPAKLFLV